MNTINNVDYDFSKEYEELKRAPTLFRPSAFEDDLMCIVEGRFGGIPCAFCEKLAFRPAEVTLWGGINGHGKSLITGQVALQLIRQGESCCVMSFEMTPARTMFRMLRQYIGRKPTTEKEVSGFINRIDSKMVFFDRQGSVDVEELFGAIAVAHRDFGTNQIFVDNLMKVVAGEDNYNAQKDFVQGLTDIARQLNIHIHLVHHVRKGGTEDDEIGKFSFKGSGAIVDQVDNAVLIQRNRKKEQKRNDFTLSEIEDQETADSILRIVKQRNGDFEGAVNLWFNHSATSFCKSPDRKTTWE